MSNSYCVSLGLPYDCDTPLPRSAFETSGPLCESLGAFLYDPANCDPGYWCGCSSTDPSLCFPSNQTEGQGGTRWGGRFTTTNHTTNETIVLVGLFDGVQNKCPKHYYCPGKNEPYRCVDLCEPKMVCTDPGQMLPCPEGSYCPVGTVDPISCRGLEACNEEGLRRFNVGKAVGVLLCILFSAVAYLFVGRNILNRRARSAKLAKLALKNNEHHDDDTHGAQTDDERDHHNGSVERAYQEGVSRRRSTLTPPEMTIDIEFDRLSLTIPNVGTIMRGVSGKIRHGRMTAIMGPSGSGKTTFLNIMSGKLDRTGGSLKVNGVETELTNYRNIIGFVPQEDIMLRELTVEEIITHSALMRLPSNWSHDRKLARVDEILESLEIDHIRDAVVGDEKRRGISGGERKRVNIAMEMVTKPSLLCLDEPTSGLDSTTCLTVVETLRAMAMTGANVITVLHQPKYEVFHLFDEVMLLGQGGMIAYYGPTEQMPQYFEERGFRCPEKVNPADFYMDVVSGTVPHASNSEFVKEDIFVEWMCAEENPNQVSRDEAQKELEKMKQQASAEAYEEVTKGKKRRFLVAIKQHASDLYAHLFREFKQRGTSRETPGVVKQTQLLFKRAAIQRLRTPYSSLLIIVLMVAAGSVLPSLVPDDASLYVGIPITLEEDNSGQEAYLRQNVKPVDYVPGILQTIYMFLLMVSCLSVNVVGPERVVFFRETATGQYVFAYWFAKTLETFLWLPIFISAFTLLGYSDEAWLLQPLKRFWLFMFLNLVGFYGFGMFASLLVGASSAALLALVFGIVVVILFSGTINAFGDASSSMQNFISCWFMFWSTQGMVSEEYDQYRYAFDVERLNDETPDKYDFDFGIGAQAVGAGLGMGFDLSSNFARNASYCALTAFVWHILVLWTMKTKDHKKQR